VENKPGTDPQNGPQNGVWVSKEEYERLRATSGVTPSPVSPNGPELYGSVPAIGQKSRRWTILSGIMAVILFICLTTEAGRAFTPLIIICLIVFSALAIRSLLLSEKSSALAAGYSRITGSKRGPTRTIVTILAIIIAIVVIVQVAPFIIIIGFILFMALTGQTIGI